MLDSNIIAGESPIEILNSILFDFHSEGPVNADHLETLAYIKKYQPELFASYESKLMYLMGLFYKTSEPSSFTELIYHTFAESIFQETGRRFTPIQADAYNSIRKYSNFSFSAPTSAGKSFLYQELLQETEGDIIIVVPSRALLSEYIITVQELVNNDTLVLPFIEIVNTNRTRNRIFIVTPERGEELFKNIDRLNLELILFDEAQLAEEGIRGMKFDSFVRRVDKRLPNVKKVFTHPFVSNPEAQLKKHQIVEDSSSEAYNQKTVGKIFLTHHRGRFKYFSPYDDRSGNNNALSQDIVQDILLGGGTALIYVSKQKIYDGSFLERFTYYIESCDFLSDESALSYIKELEEFFGSDNEDKSSQLINLMRRGIVIHHGSIPLKARLIIEEFVNKKHAKICFSTSTLIQGINMPFDVVWINNFIFNGSEEQRKLSLKNLIGRAGRTTLQDNHFDFGYVIIESRNKNTFINRLDSDTELSEESILDEEEGQTNEDYRDIIDAIKNDTFNNDLHLTESQIERITNSTIDDKIRFILDHFLNDNLEPITGRDYYNLEDTTRRELKKSFEVIYTTHLRRDELHPGEKSVLSTSIPILLWQIQGKSFSEIISLRHAFLSEKDFRRRLRTQFRREEITAAVYRNELEQKKVRFSCIAEPLPSSSFRRSVPLFRNTSVTDIDFDKIIYDTYDYIDKVIGLSLKDPISSTFTLYAQRTNDSRAVALSNYIKFGTNNEKEIWLIRYGFTFDEIEILLEHVEEIDETEIKFKPSIDDLESNRDLSRLLSRYR